MAPYLLSSSRRSRIIVSATFVAAALLWQASPVHAQLDPTLFLKRSQPNVLLLVDTLRAATASGLSEVKLRDLQGLPWFIEAFRVNAFLRGDLAVNNSQT